MKKDRNYMPYPMYPMNPNMNPNFSGMGINYDMNQTVNDSLQNLQGQINMLEKRVSNLENELSKGYKYNDSNYHIM